MYRRYKVVKTMLAPVSAGDETLKIARRFYLSIGLAMAALSTTSAEEFTGGNWPEFRGPTGQGIAENAAPPLEWGQTKNVVWKIKIPGEGWSSPSIYDGAIYLTSAIVDNDGNPSSLRALRVNAATGALVWNKEVFPWSGPSKKQPKNGFSSPTPIVAEDRVYVHFGPMGTACLDVEGNVLWRQTELAYDTPHGNGASPILYDGKLIYSCDDVKNPFLAAIDQHSGKVVWKTMRDTAASRKFSFCTPLIIEDHGRKLVVSPGSGAVCAYDPGDGAEVWRVSYGEGYSIIPRPVFSHDMIFVATGFAKPCSVYAIRTGGRGDVTDSHVAWTSKDGAPHTPSMLAVGDELYFVSDRGEFSCVDAVTGRPHWQEKLRGKFSASPVYARNRIYVTNEEGKTVVVRAGKKFLLLAENDLKERTYASPALCGKTVFIRTERHLYRIDAG